MNFKTSQDIWDAGFVIVQYSIENDMLHCRYGAEYFMAPIEPGLKIKTATLNGLNLSIVPIKDLRP
jgi:hypothetical protein